MGGGSVQNRFAIQFVDGCFNQIGNDEDIGGYASLALDPNTNAVNLSYYDFYNLDLRYAYKEDNSNVWYTMIIDGIGSDVGLYTSLAVDNSGNRHISYYDDTNNDLKYAFGPSGNSDISWQLYFVDTPGDVGEYTSLAVDNEGNRHISYRNTTNDDLKYAFGPSGNSDITWQLYSVDVGGFQVGLYTSLAVDNSGNRHISYYDDTNDDLKYAYGPAGTGDISWQLYSVDTTGNVGEYTSLAVDNEGNRHISYRDTTNSGLKYAYGPVGTGDISWQLYSVDTSGNVGLYTSIALNPTTQKPSISYFKSNGTGSNEIRIARQTLNSDTRWEIGVLDGSLNTFSFNGNSQLKFDNNGDKHLSYYDYLNIGIFFDFDLGRLRYALNPAGQYGYACPIFTTTTFDVSKEEIKTSFVTNRTDFLVNPTSPTFQKPINLSPTIVPPCPPE